MMMITPAVFFGHGNPMHAISRNGFTEGWARIGSAIGKPKGILCVSAHWYYAGATSVTIATSPRTIHDFGGFPPELFAVQYPAPGDPALARRVRELLAPVDAVVDDEQWGLDHGTWSVLRHAYPDADVPVVQLSIDAGRAPQFHYDVGRRLAPLREEGILIAGSGNLVHNLRAYQWGAADPSAAPAYAWASAFEQRARDLLLTGSHGPLIAFTGLGPEAALSIPTPDHYLPLLYVLGAALPDESPAFPVSGIEGGSISMLAVQCGGKA